MFGTGLQLFFYLLVPWTALVFFLAFRSGKGSLGHALGRTVLGLLALAVTVPTVIAFAFGVGAYGKGHGLGLLIAGAALLVGMICLMLWGLFFGLSEAPPLTLTPAEEESRTRARRLAAGVLAGGLVVGGVAGMLWRREQPSHERDIVLLSLSFDESEVLSRDRDGTVKRWATSSGRYLGRFDNSSTGYPVSSLQAGPGDTLLVAGQHGRDWFYTGFGVRSPDADFSGRLSTFTPRGEVLTVEGYGCLKWSSPRKPYRPVRRFCWPRGILAVASDESGAAHAVNGARDVMTIAGDPPEVRREVKGLGRRWQRILAEPGGTVLVVDDEGRGGVVFGGDGGLRELPDPVRLERVGFLGPTALVYGREELRVIDLVTFQVTPYAEGGAALVASARHARTVVARGRDLYMISPPAESGAGGARAWRLRPWFF